MGCNRSGKGAGLPRTAPLEGLKGKFSQVAGRAVLLQKDLGSVGRRTAPAKAGEGQCAGAGWTWPGAT